MNVATGSKLSAVAGGGRRNEDEDGNNAQHDQHGAPLEGKPHKRKP